jgi:tRNA pseudouridine38/39 synthase
MNWETAVFQKHVLKIAYLGTKYHGIAWQDDSLPTVELSLLQALIKTCLIKDRASCAFSRCGRTDKGVHAFGNYISLNLRVRTGTNKPFDYLRMLNRLLPNDIRVLSVRPVSDKFDARFSCKQRTYKYFFSVLDDMDLSRMIEASKLFVGTHDFRNFCRMDVNQTTNYVRTVKSVSFKKDDVLPIYEVCIVGTAFLWHQVRCMMACLLLIGEGVEDQSVVESLLDLDVCPRKPIYELADPAGLVLFDCEFENDLAGDALPADSEDGLEALRNSLADSYRDTAVMKCLASNRGLQFQKRIKYTQILKRATAPSLEEKIEINGIKKRRLESHLEDVE